VHPVAACASERGAEAAAAVQPASVHSKRRKTSTSAQHAQQHPAELTQTGSAWP
jgi:hypothetical protein